MVESVLVIMLELGCEILQMREVALLTASTVVLVDSRYGERQEKEGKKRRVLSK